MIEVAAMTTEVRQRQGLRCLEGSSGWDHILDALSGAVADWEAFHGPIGQWRATEVYRKFGVLRIRSTGGNQHISALVEFAERMSSRTCQKCGAPGKLRTDVTITRTATLCDQCVAQEPAQDETPEALARRWEIPPS